MENETLKKLLIQYDQKKVFAEMKFEEKLEKLYAENPELEKVNNNIKKCGILINKEILLGNNIDSLKNDLENFKKQKSIILKSLCISVEDLKPQYECKLCNDSGYVLNENNTKSLCSCIMQKMFDIEYNKSNITNAKTENFNNFNINFYSDEVNQKDFQSNISPRENIEKVKEICINFIKNFDNPNTRNLLFTGNSGLGKTFLSNCIADEILKSKKTVLYQTASNMLENIINYKFGKSNSFENIYENILNVDLLIIDDLGTESINNVKFEELFNIINSRLLNQTQNHITKTIISTNLSLKDLSIRYDQRIVSRLIGSYDICRFFGEDIRLKKKKL